MTATAIETTSDTTRTSWEEHTEAARDLILVALDRVHGTIESADGHLVSKLRDLCRLDATPTTRATITEALVLMEEAGLIQRDFIAETICSISLTRELSGGEIGELVASEEDSRKLLSTHSSATRERERILQDCMEAYRAFCRAADAAELVNEHGYVALNFTGVAKSIGLIRRDAKRARHYLRLLKLIKSHGVCNDATEPGDSERHLYWWEVTTNVTIDPAALMELMSGEQSFEAEEARRIEKQARREVGARRPSPLDIPPRPPATVTEQPDVDPLVALVELATQLETANGELTRQCEQLRGELEKIKAAHAGEIASLNERIAALQSQAVARDTAAAAARELLARHNKV